MLNLLKAHKKLIIQIGLILSLILICSQSLYMLLILAGIGASKLAGSIAEIVCQEKK